MTKSSLTISDPNAPAPENPKILIVDDDPLILKFLGISMAAFGYEYSSAADGLLAVEELKKDTFGIVITDMMMPNMDGMQLLKHIKDEHPDIDVIVVTGYTGSFSYTDVIRAGASDFISKPFNADELEAKISRIIREQRTIRELEHLSKCDSLTNLYNRRHFDMKLWEEVHRANRQDYPLFLAMLDVDRFKEYNDTFGHQAGDKVLLAIAKIIGNSTRKNVDLNYRYGGDEFAVIIPQTSQKQAITIMKRVLTGFDAGDFGNTDLSIGLAQFIRHPKKSWAQDMANFVSRADKAMYKAKALEKIRLVCDKK